MSERMSGQMLHTLRRLAKRKHYCTELPVATLAAGKKRGWIVYDETWAIITELGRMAIDGSSRDIRHACPICGAPLALRRGPFSEFYGCSNYPTCTGKRSIPKDYATMPPLPPPLPNEPPARGAVVPFGRRR